MDSSTIFVIVTAIFLFQLVAGHDRSAAAIGRWAEQRKVAITGIKPLPYPSGGSVWPMSFSMAQRFFAVGVIDPAEGTAERVVLKVGHIILGTATMTIEECPNYRPGWMRWPFN
jgi:hypothetical protein